MGESSSQQAVPKWATAVVLVLALAVFLPSVSNGFALDDQPLAGGEWALQPGQPDPVIGALHAPGFYFSKFYWWMEYVNDGLYRPLTIYSFALTYNLICAPFLSPAAEAIPHHLINVLLHGLATFMVLRLLIGVGLRRLAAHIGAGLFAIHAIHSEAVAGVVGRAELLAFVGGLAGVLAFVKGIGVGVGVGGLCRAGWLVAAGLAFFVGYCAKESALAFAPWLGCCLVVRGIRTPGGMRAQPFGLAAIVSLVPMAVFLLLRSQAIAPHRVAMIDYVANPLWQADGLVRFCTAVKLWGFGLYQCLAPFDLSASYGASVFEVSQSVFDLGFLAAMAVLGTCLVVGLSVVRSRPVVFLAMASFLGLGFITSNVPFATGTIYAERLYYAPSLGVCMLAAWLFDRLAASPGPRWRQWWRRWMWWALVAWALCSGSTALSRNGVWRDNATLFLLEARNQPRSADMHVKAAGVLRAAGGPNADELGFEHLAAALRLVDEYPHALREQAALHRRRGEWDAAIGCYTRAWRSEYRELPSTKEIAVVGLLATLQRKGVSVGAADLPADLVKAIRRVERRAKRRANGARARPAR